MSLPQLPTAAGRPSRLIAAFNAALGRLFGRGGGREAAAATARPAAAAITPDYAKLVNALPDPILVISGTDPEDITGRRYVFANPAARELLRMDQSQGLLVSAIRDPQVL